MIDQPRCEKEIIPPSPSSEVEAAGEGEEKEDDDDLDMSKQGSPKESIAELIRVIADNNFHGKRRMYACAAMKLLATQPHLRLQLIRTQGVLTSLFHVIYGKYSLAQECAFAGDALVFLLTDMQLLFDSSPCCSSGGTCTTPCQLLDPQDLGGVLLTFVHKNRHIFRDYGLEEDDLIVKATTEDHSAELKATIKSLNGVLSSCSTSRESAATLVRGPLLLILIFICSKCGDETAETICAQIFAQLTRDKHNIYHLVYHVDGFLRALSRQCGSANTIGRTYACLAIQNISYELRCVSALATSPQLIDNICLRCLDSNESDVVHAACLVTLRNICRSASNVERMFDAPLFMKALIAVIRTKELHKENMHLLFLAKDLVNSIIKLFQFCSYTNNRKSKEEIVRSDSFSTAQSELERKLPVCWKPFVPK